MNEAIATVIIVLLLANLVGLVWLGTRVSGQSSENRQLADRLTRLETRVDNMPTHRDLTELRGGIAEMAEAIATISGQTQAMTQMLRTIQEHLLENDR